MVLAEKMCIRDRRYLENQIRATFGLEGTPIRLTIRQKEDKEG